MNSTVRELRGGAGRTKKASHPERESLLKMSSPDADEPELARASRNRKLRMTPSCVPDSFDSQSHVSISSDSQRSMSMGLSMAMTRSGKGLRRTRRGMMQ